MNGIVAESLGLSEATVESSRSSRSAHDIQTAIAGAITALPVESFAIRSRRRRTRHRCAHPP